MAIDLNTELREAAPGVNAGTSIFRRDSDSEFIAEFYSRYQRAESSSVEWRKDAKKYFKAYSGDPWPDGVKESLESSDRPTVNPNYATMVINTVLGQDMADRQEVRYKPVDVSQYDGVVADWLTRLVRYFYSKSHGHRVESQARLDQLITGLGWSEVYIDVSQVPFQVKMSHVPVYEMYWDPASKDDNLTDAEYVIRKRKWDRKRLLARWPDAKDVIPGHVGSISPVASRTTYYKQVVPLGTYGEGKDKMDYVTVLEYQYRVPEPWVAYISDPVVDEQSGEVLDPGGEQIQVPLKEFNSRFSTKVGSEKPPRPLEWVRYTKDVYYRAYLLEGREEADTALLEPPKPIRQDQYTYKCITGLRHVNVDKEEVTWFGLMHLVFEMQLLAAKIFSSTVEMLIRSNKGGGFIDEDALLDPDRFFDELSRPGSWHVVKSGMIDQIRDKPQVRFPSFHGELLGMTQNLIQQMTGVSSFLQGTAQNERSNVYVSNLQSRSLIALGPLTDPYQAYRLEIGRIMAESIRIYMSDSLIDKVINDEGIEGITGQKQVNPETGQEEMQILATPSQLIRNRDLTDFDVTVDTGMANPSEKQAVWNTLGQVLPDLIKSPEMVGAVQAMLPDLAKYLPIPTEMANQISVKIEEQMQQQQQMNSIEGIQQFMSQQPPEMIEQVMETLGGILGQYQSQEQQAMPPAEGGEQPPM